MPLPVSPDEWDRRAAAQGCEWTAPVGPARIKVGIRCLTCGHEWKTRPQSVTQGRGCPRCRKTQAARKQRKSQGQRDAEAAQLGLEWLASCERAGDHVPIRCLTCGHEWTSTPKAVRIGTGCPNCAGRVGVTRRVVTPDELRRRASDVGAEWIEEYSNGTTPTGIRCLKCGHEWRARPSDVSKGAGCPKCANNLPITQERRNVEAAAVGAEWIERCSDSHTRAGLRCLTCSHEWKATPNSIRKGTGCPRCSGSVVTAEDWAARAAALDLRFREPVTRGTDEVKQECLKCGQIVTRRAEYVSQGFGCPSCASYGYDPSAPSLVYLLSDSRSGAKVGIANLTERRDHRIAQHERRGWRLHERWDLPTGAHARAVERAILRWWRDELKLPPAYVGRDGDTETVDTRKVSLEVIRARIEAEIAALANDV